MSCDEYPVRVKQTNKKLAERAAGICSQEPISNRLLMQYTNVLLLLILLLLLLLLLLLG